MAQQVGLRGARSYRGPCGCGGAAAADTGAAGRCAIAVLIDAVVAGLVGAGVDIRVYVVTVRSTPCRRRVAVDVGIVVVATEAVAIDAVIPGLGVSGKGLVLVVVAVRGVRGVPHGLVTGQQGGGTLVTKAVAVVVWIPRDSVVEPIWIDGAIAVVIDVVAELRRARVDCCCGIVAVTCDCQVMRRALACKDCLFRVAVAVTVQVRVPAVWGASAVLPRRTGAGEHEQDSKHAYSSSGQFGPVSHGSSASASHGIRVVLSDVVVVAG